MFGTKHALHVYTSIITTGTIYYFRYSKYLLKFFKSIHSSSRVSRQVARMILLLLCSIRCFDILTFWTPECGIQCFYTIILLRIPATRSWSTIRSSISSKNYTRGVEVRDRCRHHLYGGESDGRTPRVVQWPRTTRLALLVFTVKFRGLAAKPTIEVSSANLAIHMNPCKSKPIE